jgi:two-component system, NarL family, nitrate/nitrite response regulator NarL
MPEPLEKTVTILIVDDHALFRESVARLLATEPGFDVTAHCGSIEEALKILRQMSVDIVLLDFDLGERDGTEFMRLAKQQGFAGRVLVVTAGVEDSKVAELIHTGISGIFMKHNSAASLPQGIRAVMSGKVWFDQELLQEAISGDGKRRAEPTFTQRERQVLSFVFEGLANKQIAEKIGVSESSVKATLQQLFSKTGVHTRSQLVRIALEQYKDQI